MKQAKAAKKKATGGEETGDVEKPKAPSKAKGRGKKKMEVVVEVPSPQKLARSNKEGSKY